jgi:hypothetical protein
MHIWRLLAVSSVLSLLVPPLLVFTGSQPPGRWIWVLAMVCGIVLWAPSVVVWVMRNIITARMEAYLMLSIAFGACEYGFEVLTCYIFFNPKPNEPELFLFFFFMFLVPLIILNRAILVGIYLKIGREGDKSLQDLEA